ncbi:MAG TPA: CheR family methyltransferase [Candidatus Sulfotelmatobacter sp.]|nr:CheR family methyltransferase [Candidatus Sulfotelmatobacter sp.]
MAREVNGWFDKILALLHQHTGVDFTNYKQATLRRRIERRMNARKIGSFNEYCQYLRKNRSEAKELFNDILIPVTSFFRDPGVFKALKTTYFPQLLRSNHSNEPLRIWVPACSTGEELYSLAMILAELKEAKKDPREVQIFGTDISERALERARAGLYPQSIGKQVSAERLRRFFGPVKAGYAIRKEIRDLCIFARHNLAVDPPFSNLDFISCRNALIYMTPALQSRILAIFHFALKPAGLLLLGPSETTDGSSNRFTIGDRKINLFRRKAHQKKQVPPAFLQSSDFDRPSHVAARRAAATSIRELNPSQLRFAVEKIIQRGEEMEMESQVVPITIPKTGEKAYLVFGAPKKPDKRKPGPSGATGGPDKDLEVENAKLRKELFGIRKAVEMIIEQQEATNEELRAANEEVVSSNEELQSTNEELETAKEELQASNEEMATLNTELESRNGELERANAISGHFKAIVESSDDAIISKDLNGVIRTWNKGAEKIFGYTAEEAVGKPVTILIPPDHIDEEPGILARIRAGDRIDHYETVRVRKDGQLIDISLTVSPIKDDAGRITGASKIARDITAKKRTEMELKQARDEAERASRAKDDFLAALSHELRTPLNPVLLVASDAVSDPELPPGVRASFDTILKNVELEAKLIDDLLDLARVRAGKLKVEKHYVNVYSVLTSTLAIVQNEIDKKCVALKQKFDDTRSVILGDTVRLQQVFWNILRNAVKFTSPGGAITIETSATREKCIVKISDTGIGMSGKELAHVFDAFKQGDHSVEPHRFGGLGLGLTISKKLVDLHSGVIEASSKGRGAGSCFTITFPLAEWSGNTDRKASMGRINQADKSIGLQVLLVEDHEPTRSALARLLANRQHRVMVAGSVSEAVSLSEKTHFDLVISDIGLPDGSGYDLFKNVLKHSPNARGIALTGYGMDEDLARSKESGFSMHLTKPVKIDALDDALAGFSK